MRNRIDKYKGRIIVICTVCNDPILVPLDLERAVLHSDHITCPKCRQRSHVPQSLKEYILHY